MPYDQLNDLPMINGVTIIGDRTLEDYGIRQMSAEDVLNLFYEVFGYVL